MSKILAIKTKCDFVYTGDDGGNLVIADYSKYSKAERQEELEFWRDGCSQVRFVLVNPDGTGIQEL